MLAARAARARRRFAQSREFEARPLSRLSETPLDKKCALPRAHFSSRGAVRSTESSTMVLSLTCAVQNYDWGITGDSEVASLGERNTGNAADHSKPHAELWMGTHPSGPSFVQTTGVGLKETIASNAEEFLGEIVHKRFGEDLPFLTKVLSVAKALSIQAHPDKTSAKALHADRPNVYKDSNHKPEMTLAITRFEALCGFVSFEELSRNLETVPELRATTGEEIASAFVEAVKSAADESRLKTDLKKIFTAVMTASSELIHEQIKKLVKRLSASKNAANNAIDSLALRLESQYPGDVGVLCAYVLNYVVLQPGQCLFLAANEPHAYLAGECVECMATSDNVVRAGLTPKLRDTAILCDMLTYETGEPKILNGVDLVLSDSETSKKSNSIVKQYVPPFDEFMLETYAVPSGETCAVAVSQGPCIFLVQKGAGTLGGEKIARGSVVFAKASEEVDIVAETEQVVAYRAMINTRVFV